MDQSDLTPPAGCQVSRGEEGHQFVLKYALENLSGIDGLF